jgi:hypothetical protein
LIECGYGYLDVTGCGDNMVFNPQAGDVVLARFCIGGGSDKTIRFIKRKGKFYQINDIDTYKRTPSLGVRIIHNGAITEITPVEIIKLINAALSATMNGDEETYEIWVNDNIYQRLFGE